VLSHPIALIAQALSVAGEIERVVERLLRRATLNDGTQIKDGKRRERRRHVSSLVPESSAIFWRYCLKQAHFAPQVLCLEFAQFFVRDFVPRAIEITRVFGSEPLLFLYFFEQRFGFTAPPGKN
jgi:hypothetical protein